MRASRLLGCLLGSKTETWATLVREAAITLEQ